MIYVQTHVQYTPRNIPTMDHLSFLQRACILRVKI